MFICGESKMITFRESTVYSLFILFLWTSLTYNIWLTTQFKSPLIANAYAIKCFVMWTPYIIWIIFVLSQEVLVN